MATPNELIQSFNSIIQKMKYMTVATCDKDSQPWNTPLFTAYDDKYNFYWISDKDNVHSKNIRENSKTFAVIFDTNVNFEGAEGVYMQGNSSEISDPLEILRALKILLQRFDGFSKDVLNFQGLLPKRIYKFTPVKIWLNDDSTKNGEHVDVRVEVPILNQK